MWRSELEIWIAWSIVALVTAGVLFMAGSWMAGQLDERTMKRIELWSRLSLSAIFLYGGVVKLTNPWIVLANSITQFKVGFTWDSVLLHPLAVAVPWSEVALAILLLFPLRWVVLTAGAVLAGFLALGVVSTVRGMQVTCGCWGGTMLVGPLWFGEHGGMFLMAIVADNVFAKRFIRVPLAVA